MTKTRQKELRSARGAIVQMLRLAILQAEDLKKSMLADGLNRMEDDILELDKLLTSVREARHLAVEFDEDFPQDEVSV